MGSFHPQKKITNSPTKCFFAYVTPLKHNIGDRTAICIFFGKLDIDIQAEIFFGKLYERKEWKSNRLLFPSLVSLPHFVFSNLSTSLNLLVHN